MYCCFVAWICIAATQRCFFSLLGESTQKLTWQKSTFTNCIHLFKAVDQKEQGISKAQNENTSRHAWCLTTMNTFIEALSFPSQVSPLPSSCDTFFILLLLFSILSLKLLTHNDQNAWRQMESLWFGVLICETGRWYKKEQMMTVSTCSAPYHYQPLSTLFSKQPRCVTRPHFVLGILHQKEKWACVL